MMRKTLKNSISCTGIGIHCGRKVSMTLTPAEAGTGVVFKRVDVPKTAILIPALSCNAQISQLCTTLVDADSGVSVFTVEHLLSALSALEVDDVIVEINGPEVPIMDGSAAPFVFLIECAGLRESTTPRRAWKIIKPVTVSKGDSTATLGPLCGHDDGRFIVDFEINFPVEAIGRQSCLITVTPSSFKDSLMRARTFGLVDDIPKLRAAGLGLGGSLDNAILVNGAEILNDGGLRYNDEFVRHKALDAIGDLSLAGLPIIGRYTGYKSSHTLNGLLVQAMLDDPTVARQVFYQDHLTDMRPALAG